MTLKLSLIKFMSTNKDMIAFTNYYYSTSPPTCAPPHKISAMSTHRNLPCLHTGTCHVYTQELAMSTHRNLPCLHTGTCLVYTQEPAMSTHRNLPCRHRGTRHVYTQEPAMSTYTQEPALSTHRNGIKQVEHSKASNIQSQT